MPVIKLTIIFYFFWRKNHEKVEFLHLPPPIEYLPRLSEELGIKLYIKRDDLTNLGVGGNKLRKLEYLLADAKVKGAEVVFTTGGALSNHAMLTAATCRKLGMEPILILKKRCQMFKSTIGISSFQLFRKLL